MLQQRRIFDLAIYQHSNNLPCSFSLRFLSTTNAHSSHQYAADMGEKSEEKKETPFNKLARYIPSSIKRFFNSDDRMTPQSNAGYASKTGGPEYKDKDIPFEILMEDAPQVLKRELKKTAREVSESMTTGHYAILSNPDLYHDFFSKGPEYRESIVEYKFKTDKDMDKWRTGCDSDWSEGYSKCDFYQSDRGTAIFEGVLSSRVVKDGRTERAGWCSMRTIDKAGFGLRRCFTNWDNYSHFLIKCRGDGRSYKMMLFTPYYFDMTWGYSYSYPLHTHGGPYWQYELIPFSRFIFTNHGRVADSQYEITKPEISSVGITLMDRLDGPFRLEVSFIGVMHDPTHTEKKAYETYNSPLANPLY